MPDVYSVGNDADDLGSFVDLESWFLTLPSGYVISEPDELENVTVSTFAMDPVTAADASGLKAILLDLLGDYDAVQVEWAYENNNGYTSYTREIQPDYPWLCSAAIFAIVLYCLIRMGVAMLCKR